MDEETEQPREDLEAIDNVGTEDNRAVWLAAIETWEGHS